MSDVRLADEEREALWQSGEVSSINTEPDSNLVAAVESILAARTAALIDRAERAERERDKRLAAAVRLEERARRERDTARAELAALRAAVTGLADEIGREVTTEGSERDRALFDAAEALRALLTDEGDNQ